MYSTRQNKADEGTSVGEQKCSVSLSFLEDQQPLFLALSNGMQKRTLPTRHERDI